MNTAKIEAELGKIIIKKSADDFPLTRIDEANCVDLIGDKFSGKKSKMQTNPYEKGIPWCPLLIQKFAK